MHRSPRAHRLHQVFTKGSVDDSKVRGSSESLVDCDAAAAYLGNVSTSFLAKRRLTGNGPAFVKLGRRVMYRVEDLDAWVQNNRRVSTSE